MLKSFIVKGLGYHDNKDDFKKIIKKYNMKWGGSRTAGGWSCENVSVRVMFIRDDEKDITIESRFEVEGIGEGFEELCNYIETKMKGEKKSEEDSNWDFQVFEMIYKPNEEYLQSINAPESYKKYLWKQYEIRKNGFIEGKATGEVK